MELENVIHIKVTQIRINTTSILFVDSGSGFLEIAFNAEEPHKSKM